MSIHRNPIYADPQGSFVPKSWGGGQNLQATAELGFVLVQIDGMGTNDRSKAFHDVAWKNLADAGFPDRILWHQAANAKHPWYDITRVGVYGGSAGGQNAAGAVLFHPEFYDAAVASSGCHDNRMDKIWWNELWMGEMGPHYAASSNITQADRPTGTRVPGSRPRRRHRRRRLRRKPPTHRARTGRRRTVLRTPGGLERAVLVVVGDWRPGMALLLRGEARTPGAPATTLAFRFPAETISWGREDARVHGLAADPDRPVRRGPGPPGAGSSTRSAR